MRTSRHRVLGRRQCACGTWFEYTSKAPERRACRKTCIGWKQAIGASMIKVERRKRIMRWRERVQRVLHQEHVRVGDLIDLCAEVYQTGYFAGYRKASGEQRRRTAA